jgi:hypothetical protein
MLLLLLLLLLLRLRCSQLRRCRWARVHVVHMTLHSFNL